MIFLPPKRTAAVAGNPSLTAGGGHNENAEARYIHIIYLLVPAVAADVQIPELVIMLGIKPALSLRIDGKAFEKMFQQHTLRKISCRSQGYYPP